MCRNCPERTSVTEGSGGRAILEPTVGVSISGIGVTSDRGRTFTTGRGMSKLVSQSSRPQAQARVFSMTKQ